MSKTAIFIITGALIGAFAALLSFYGNPANMGICAACFLRDTAGAFGLHNAAVVQYVRPEILGLILGGLFSAIAFKQYDPTGVSSPFSRLLLGIFAMLGALIFLGCPWRAYIRLGGGDLSALAGILGLVLGVICGRFFKKRGYALKDEPSTSKFLGFLPSILAILVLFAAIFELKLGENLPLFSSQKGPGSQHANIALSLILAVIIGFFVFKSKFCTIGAISRAIDKNFSMLYGVFALIISATIINIALNRYNLGFLNQPIAHNDMIFNLLSMTLAGLCFSLASGCPGKHLAQMGSGNLNSAIFIIGMIIGASIAHNFNMASSPKGVTPNALYTIVIGFIICVGIGILNKKRA